jgi:hypothetical protein
VDIPVVVSTDLAPTGVVVVDATGAELAALAAQTNQFWVGVVGGAAVAGDQLELHPRATLPDGRSVDGPAVVVPVVEQGGTIELRPITMTESIVYDRPWSDEPGELWWEEPVDEWEATTPSAMAAVSDHELAVLDSAASRITCFDLSGRSTCDIPLPVLANGDMFGLGDGTVIVPYLGGRGGDQELIVYRADPASGLVEPIYREFPLVVAGYAAISMNIEFLWDASSRTAWVSVPIAGPPDGSDPEPSLSNFTDALHLDSPVTRGPTLQRLTFSVQHSLTTAWPLDGNSWVRMFDGMLRPGIEHLATTSSGVIWMVVYSTRDIDPLDPESAEGSMALVRWRPGDSYADIAPFEENALWGTRLLAPLDDDTVAYLDRNDGARIRLFTMPRQTVDQVASG